MNTGRNLIIIVVVVIFMVGAAIFFVAQIGRRSLLSPPVSTPAPIAKAQISEVRLVAQGPIVANELFVSLTLTANASQRTLTATSTYTNQVIDSEVLDNNDEAYSQFLDALLNAGFIKPARNQSVAGSKVDSNCPQGTRYTYDSDNSNGDTLTSLWATSCGSNNQSLSADSGTINQLFKVQFPDINLILNDQRFQQLSL
jgi:hypothetical protein